MLLKPMAAAAMHQSHMTSAVTCQAPSVSRAHSAQSVTSPCSAPASAAHHTPALHALGSFPLAAGTNCEREVDRRAGWSCMSDSGWAGRAGKAGRAKIVPTPDHSAVLSVIDGFASRLAPGQGGISAQSVTPRRHLDKFLVSIIASHRIAPHRTATPAAAKHC